MRKSKVFDGSEPRLALYSSLITHFCHFRKTQKINAKRDAQNRVFGSENEPWAPKGRFFQYFSLIFEDSEND